MVDSILFVGVVTLVAMINIAIPTASLSIKLQKGQPLVSWKQMPVSPYRGIMAFAFSLLLVVYFTGTQLNLPQTDWGKMPEIRLPNLGLTEDRPANPLPPAPVAEDEEDSSPEPEPNTAPSVVEEEPPHAGVSSTTDDRRGRIPDWAARGEEEPIL